MRIIAGTLNGRQFAAPKGHKTHPMSDKARGGLFSVLGDIDGLSILDAFAGSGALGFEAISRGARTVLAIELDRNAQDTIVRNVKELGLRSYKLVRANAGAWSSTNEGQQFDIVFSAPPYDRLQEALVRTLVQHVKPDGLYVLDWPGNLELPEFDVATLVHQKGYGDAQLAFYRKIS